MLKKLDVPPVWALGLAIISYLLASFLPIFSFENLLSGWVSRALPLALIVGGFALALWSAFWFWRKSTAIEPRRTPTSLIVEGPYKLSRNPIYSGMALVLLGFSLLLGAVSGFVGPVGFVLIITKRFIENEEAVLRQEFGEAAETYIRATRQWLY